MSWFHKEHKFYNNLKVSFTDVGILCFKRFFCLKRNSNDIKIIDNESKQINDEMYMHDLDYVMTCTITSNSVSNTKNKLLLQYDLNSSHNQPIYNDKE